MNPLSKAYLDYVQASLTDAARLHPSIDRNNSSEVPSDLLLGGKVDRSCVQSLFDQAKKAANPHLDDERLWPIPVLVCPKVFSLRPDHGYTSSRFPKRIAPVVIHAKLRQDGQLIDDENTKAPVVAPRDLLEPTPWEVTLGTVEDADIAYAKLGDERGSWSALIKQADELLFGLTGRSLAELTVDDYVLQDYGQVQLRGPGAATFAIEALVDRLRAPDTPAVPLYEKLLDKAPDQPLLSFLQQTALIARHFGQMECRYGLAESQRELLAHFLSGTAPCVLAVDGPPGTGKTTLLLSIVATEWVVAAWQNKNRR